MSRAVEIFIFSKVTTATEEVPSDPRVKTRKRFPRHSLLFRNTMQTRSKLDIYGYNTYANIFVERRCRGMLVTVVCVRVCLSTPFCLF